MYKGAIVASAGILVLVVLLTAVSAVNLKHENDQLRLQVEELEVKVSTYQMSLTRVKAQLEQKSIPVQLVPIQTEAGDDLNPYD